MTEPIFDDLLSMLAAQRETYGFYRTFELASYLLADRVEAGPASQYLYRYARSLGYDLPAYPLAGCGEIREFFADWGVKSVPEWYATIGVSDDDYQHLHERTIVVARNFENERCAFLLDGEYHKQDKGFLSLAESGFAATMPADRLEALLQTLFDFLLRGSTGGRPRFYRLEVRLPKQPNGQCHACRSQLR